MPVVYSARYHIDIGLHVFPTAKYSRLHTRLLDAHIIEPADIVEPAPAGWDELALVHTPEYLTKIRSGTLSPEDLAELELPWSREMVEGFRLMVGGTIEAACLACGLRGPGSAVSGASADGPCGASRRADFQGPGVACHLGGGLHHAFANHGEGFCPFNDVAVAVRVLERGPQRGSRVGVERVERGLEGGWRVAIVDLDVHHGNGTAFIFESDPRVFTFSMHQQHNYPMWKPRGSLDVGLPDGTGDGAYLRALEQALPTVMASDPQCVFYLAGADPYEQDTLGGLRLTAAGLRRRDRMVIEAVRGAGVPLVVTLAGGYARHVDDTVAIHAATIEEAARTVDS
jgi:acetoin utilization deacetylase AcuC-like enzyme